MLTLGRRESCDICLRYANVSGVHCELHFEEGFWWLKDLGSTNGTKVNGARVAKKVLHPGEIITIAQRSFTINYDPPVGKRAIEELLEEMEEEDILSQPLLERAGLAKPRRELLREKVREAAAETPKLDDKPLPLPPVEHQDDEQDPLAG